jgi:hypothetical protein
MTETTPIFCCDCEGYINARLTDGKEIYPHRKDLHKLPFWKCDTCKNSVGCKYKTIQRTKPLGCIANAEIKRLRLIIHKMLDPIWQSGKCTRTELYKLMQQNLSVKEYHTAEIRSVQSALDALRVATMFNEIFIKSERS